jgi:hypothetical protein
MLWRQFSSYITKGRIAFRNERILLNENIRNTLRYNDKLRWLQSFSPINEVERDLLCKFGKIEDAEQISIVDASQKHPETTVNQLQVSLRIQKLQTCARHYLKAVYLFFKQMARHIALTFIITP